MKTVIRIVVLTFAVALAATFGLFAAFPALSARAEYVIREEEGTVIVLRRGERCETDIDPAALRQYDRERLQRGVNVSGEEALARALEDLGS